MAEGVTAKQGEKTNRPKRCKENQTAYFEFSAHYIRSILFWTAFDFLVV